MNTVKQFLQEVNSIGFWGRLFGWKRIKDMIAGALTEVELYLQKTSGLESQVKDLGSKLTVSETTLSSKEDIINGMEKQKINSDAYITRLRDEMTQVKEENAVLRNEERQRIKERDVAVDGLLKIQNKAQQNMDDFMAEQHRKEMERLEGMKKIWAIHQLSTSERIKSLCQKHTIAYVDKVPFKGEPDNTVMICKEYIVFDAKSPGSDDLTNFPTYLKSQAEKASKYSKQEGVKKDIYFVVPSNTIEHLNQYVYSHGEHDVYIIAADALEPILINLQKIEEYEFAEKMSPEDRDNICRTLGRFAHFTKRRVQVDNFFAKEALRISGDCETALPPDMLESVIEFERANRFNPPQERSSKEIDLKSLEKETKQVEKGLEDRGILPNQDGINETIKGLPLYKEEHNNK